MVKTRLGVIELKKRTQRVWLNMKVSMQKRWLGIKKMASQIWRGTAPLLKGRYWIVYILSFILGFYLFGPSRGYEQLKQWRSDLNNRTGVESIEALKKEIDLLKKDLRKIQSTEIEKPNFNPEDFRSPLTGAVIKPFEWVNSGGSWKLHAGVDIAAPPGSKVLSAADGMVVNVDELIDGSFSVRIEHGNGWESRYSNLSRVTVQEGEKVIRGFVLGTSGVAGCASEEPSIHFAVYRDNQAVNPEELISGLSVSME